MAIREPINHFKQQIQEFRAASPEEVFCFLKETYGHKTDEELYEMYESMNALFDRLENAWCEELRKTQSDMVNDYYMSDELKADIKIMKKER